MTLTQAPKFCSHLLPLRIQLVMLTLGAGTNQQAGQDFIYNHCPSPNASQVSLTSPVGTHSQFIT